MDEQGHSIAVREFVRGRAGLRVPYLYVSERHRWYLCCWYLLIPTTQIPTLSPAVTEQRWVTMGAGGPPDGLERWTSCESWEWFEVDWSPDRIHIYMTIWQWAWVFDEKTPKRTPRQPRSCGRLPLTAAVSAKYPFPRPSGEPPLPPVIRLTEVLHTRRCCTSNHLLNLWAHVNWN